jgi:hypothetical protein
MVSNFLQVSETIVVMENHGGFAKLFFLGDEKSFWRQKLSQNNLIIFAFVQWLFFS